MKSEPLDCVTIWAILFGIGGRELNKDQKIYCKVSHWPSLLFPILLFFFFIGNNKIVLSEEQQSSSTDSVIYIYV